MATSHLLDTSVYCQPIKPQPLASVMQRLEKMGDARIGISAICELEILFGIHRKQAFKLRDSYERLLKDRFQILDVDRQVAATAADVKLHREAKGNPITPFDLLIAATARAHHLTLATLNPRHFQDIEGLAVEDWSQ